MTLLHTNNDLYFCYSTLLEGKNYSEQRHKFLKVFKEMNYWLEALKTVNAILSLFFGLHLIWAGNLPFFIPLSCYVYGVFGAQRSRDCTVTVLVSQIKIEVT